MAKMDTSKIKQARNIEGEAIAAVETGTGTHGQKTPSVDEKTERLANLQTRGRKDCRAPRFNFATTPENYNFVNTMAGVTGRSVSRYLNFIIDEYRKEHADLYERALAIMADAGMEENRP